MRRIICLFTTVGLILGINLARAGDPDADAIIDKAIKAHLGSGNDAKKKGYRGKNKGTLYVAGMEIPFTQEVSVLTPSKFKEAMELTVAGMKVQVFTVFNGKEGWIKTGDKNIPVEKDLLEEFKDIASLMSISHGVFVKDKSLKLSIIGEAMVNGKPSIGVKISREGKKSIDMYFDKATNLMSKIERRKLDFMGGLGAGKEVTEERIILEYQKLGGRAHPKKVEVKVDGKKFLEAEVLEAQFLDRLDDDEFARP